ncbi:MAG: hypothetical protein HOV87_22060 [Catenulispora sp.]|nr:hypothetical protein [Catenulispora sp.]
MAGKDDIVADLSEIAVLRRSLLTTQGIVDGGVRKSMERLSTQVVDFGHMQEAGDFAAAYRGSCANLYANLSTLSGMLGDLAKAAQLIHDNYQHAANTDTISAKSVESALSGVEADFKPAS